MQGYADIETVLVDIDEGDLQQQGGHTSIDHLRRPPVSASIAAAAGSDIARMFSYAHRGMPPKTIPSLPVPSGESRYVVVYGSLEETWNRSEECLLR